MATGEGAHVLTSAPDTDIPKEPKVTQDVQVSEDCMCPLMGKLRPKRKSLGIAKEQQLPAHPAGHLRAHPERCDVWGHGKEQGKQETSGMVTCMYNTGTCEQRQKDGRFQASLGYTASACLKK